MRTLLPLLTAILLAAAPAGAQQKPAASPPPEHTQAIREAMIAFLNRDFDKSLAAIEKAEALHPPTPTTLNVRAAVAIEQRRYADGEKLCREALKLDPKYFPAKFNLAEIPFVQKQYPKARAEFEKLQTQYPKEDLVPFRIYLTYLLEGNKEKAKELLDAIPLFSDSPIYYYSHAAWEFAHNNEPEAIKWLQSGSRVFGADKTINFADVFFDLGWLKRPVAKSPAEKP